MKNYYLLALTVLLLLSACQPTPHVNTLPPPTNTTTPAPSPTVTATSPPPPSATNTPAPRTLHNYHGEWQVYIQAPTISIVKVITFAIDHNTNIITAEWTEGTRPIYLEGVYDLETGIVEGQFYNSDAEIFPFSLLFYPDEQVFRGILQLPDMLQGLFCGARPGESRPSPCRPIN